jgi:hypothetical protein
MLILTVRATLLTLILMAATLVTAAALVVSALILVTITLITISMILGPDTAEEPAAQGSAADADHASGMPVPVHATPM